MGTNLLTGIAPQAGLIAQSSGQTVAQAARSADGNVVQSQVVQQTIASGAASNPAVVVSLSSGSKSRAASYGAGKSVDASFEKQASEEHSEGSGTSEKPAKKKGSVSVTA